MENTKTFLPLDKSKFIKDMTVEELARLLNAVLYVSVKDAIADAQEEDRERIREALRP